MLGKLSNQHGQLYKVAKMYPNVFKGELMCSSKFNKDLGDYLVSAKLK